MTEYSNVPETNALYQQTELISTAIGIIDAGGSLGSMTLVPAPANPDQPPTIGRVVTIMTPPPTPSDVLTAMRGYLVQCQADIDTQLAALGVTNPPERVV